MSEAKERGIELTTGKQGIDLAASQPAIYQCICDLITELEESTTLAECYKLGSDALKLVAVDVHEMKIERDQLKAELEKADYLADAAQYSLMYTGAVGKGELHKALANYKGEIKCQICNDDDLHCNYCTKGEGK